MTLSSTMPMLLALAVSGIVAGPLGAQSWREVAIAPGSSVRVLVTKRPPGKVEGRFVGADSVAVRVVDRSSGATETLNWSMIRSIDVRVARRSRRDAFGRGAKAGAIVFGTIAVVGLAAAIVYDLNPPSDACCIPATAVAIPYGYLATVTGTAVGGLLGLADRDRWRAVWPERR